MLVEMRCANQVPDTRDVHLEDERNEEVLYDCCRAYSQLCKEQAPNDGHQEETLTANIASTRVAIENKAAKDEGTSSGTARDSQISTSDLELTAAIAVREKEIKEFSTSEAELMDVVNTFQRVIAIIQKEMIKNPVFLHKKIYTHTT